MSLLILQGKVPAGVIMNPSTYELKCLFWKGKIIWRQIYTSVLPICTVWNSKIHVCFMTLWNHWFWYQRGEKGVCLFASPAAQVPMARWAHAPTWSSLTCFIEGREKCKGRMEVWDPSWGPDGWPGSCPWLFTFPEGGIFCTLLRLPNFIRKKLRSSGAVFHTLNTMPQKQQLREREEG